MQNKREKWEDRHTREDLSRDDLLFLLSILEGELQVRSLTTTYTYILLFILAHVKLKSDIKSTKWGCDSNYSYHNLFNSFCCIVCLH